MNDIIFLGKKEMIIIDCSIYTYVYESYSSNLCSRCAFEFKICRLDYISYHNGFESNNHSYYCNIPNIVFGLRYRINIISYHEESLDNRSLKLLSRECLFNMLFIMHRILYK